VLPSDVRKLTAGWVQIPHCTLSVPDDALDRLRAAGFVGKIEFVTLLPGRAWLGGAAGRVTTTRPRRGAIVKPETKVSVYVNPGVAGALSARDRDTLQSDEARYAREVSGREQIFIDAPSPRPNSEPSPPVTENLSTALLHRLEDCLASRGALMSDWWRPGLRDAEIDALLMPVGIDLPEEARIWWRWHDGVEVMPDGRVHSLAGRQLLTLSQAVEVYEQFRGLNNELYGVDGLIQLFGEQPTIYADCSRRPQDPVPIYTIGHTGPCELALGSIGDLVLGIIDLLECGALSVDPEGHVVSDRTTEPVSPLPFL
jgi:hypothetical protein